MNRSLIWNENQDKVYGEKSKFISELDFINELKNNCEELTGNDCIVSKVSVKSFVKTADEIIGEDLQSRSDCDTKKCEWYIADVEVLEPIALDL